MILTAGSLKCKAVFRGRKMHTTIFAASTRLWNHEFKKLARASRPVSYEKMRRAEDPRENRVRFATVRWARTIPSALRPRALVIQFPRIANTMADVWCQPKVFHMLLCQLMVDDRGGRKGFPLEVKRDLIKLRMHFDRTHKQKSVLK